jgi:hypothetical protein
MGSQGWKRLAYVRATQVTTPHHILRAEAEAEAPGASERRGEVRPQRLQRGVVVRQDVRAEEVALHQDGLGLDVHITYPRPLRLNTS